MTDTRPADLSGTVDERIAQLATLDGDAVDLPAGWLRRQLEATRDAGTSDETKIDIESQTRADY